MNKINLSPFIADILQGGDGDDVLFELKWRNAA